MAMVVSVQRKTFAWLTAAGSACVFDTCFIFQFRRVQLTVVEVVHALFKADVSPSDREQP